MSRPPGPPGPPEPPPRRGPPPAPGSKARAEADARAEAQAQARARAQADARAPAPPPRPDGSPRASSPPPPPPPSTSQLHEPEAGRKVARRPGPSSTTPPPPPLNEGISEFGECMAQLLRLLPEASGAVLSDESGEPIDSAHRPDRINEIDIQIAGAQLGQLMSRTYGNAMVFGLGPPTVIAESERGMLIARCIQHDYLYTLVIDRKASLNRVLPCFETSAQLLAEFIG